MLSVQKIYSSLAVVVLKNVVSSKIYSSLAVVELKNVVSSKIYSSLAVVELIKSRQFKKSIQV